MKSDTLVLGGGLVGSYCAYKLKVQLVTLNSSDAIPYIFLHDEQENRDMLDDLKIEYDFGTWYIGFMYKGTVYGSATPDMVFEYHEKCYGHPPLRDKPQFLKPYYKILTTNYYSVRKRLSNLLMNDTRYGRVIYVDLLQHKVALDDGTSIEYKKLVNTLPLPDFMHMAGMKTLFEARPLFIYKCSKWDYPDYDTVQIMEGSDLRTRFVKGTEEPNTYFLETISQEPKYGELATVIKYGKILNNSFQLDLRNNTLERLEKHDVFCIGRASRWTQHFDTHDALRVLNGYIEKGLL